MAFSNVLFPLLRIVQSPDSGQHRTCDALGVFRSECLKGLFKGVQMVLGRVWCLPLTTWPPWPTGPPGPLAPLGLVEAFKGLLKAFNGL